MAILSFSDRDLAAARANKSVLAQNIESAGAASGAHRSAECEGSLALASLLVADQYAGSVRYLRPDRLSATFDRVQSRKYEFAKRAIDLALVALLSPFIALSILAIGAVVAITTRGPILYTQKRIGRYGQPFKIFKFRTMKADAEMVLAEHLLEDPRACLEWFHTHKLREDPRVTACGRFLRRTSLDELPQLLNVLRGEMSLVGPRPIVSAEQEKYGERFCFYSAAIPGVSGLWQVSGRCDVTYDTRVALDERYVRNWSLTQDLLILVRTPKAVWGRSGAY